MKGNQEKHKEMWEEIGCHRALGGAFYRSAIALIAMTLGLGLGAIVLPLLIPYPSSQGYRGVVQQMMTLVFTIFDIGIASSVTRFVAEYRVKDLKKALQYASFFIWYQAFTGIIQVTLVSIYGLFILPSTDLAYTIWFIIVYSLVQWPSSTGIFKELLRSFQHHDKVELIDVLQGSVVEIITQVTFILIFRMIGRANPAFGELMGITVGWIIGVMADDIICMAIAGKWFQDILNEVTGGKLGIIDILRPNFSLPVAKESIIFGIQNMGASLIGSIQGTVLIWIWIKYLPAYTFYLGIASIVGGMIMRAGNEFNSGIIPAITESYNNKKFVLSSYYITNGVKYLAFFITFMDVLNFAVFPRVIGGVLEVTGEFYLAAIVGIPFQVILSNFEPIKKLFFNTIKNTGHITFYVLLHAISVLINIIVAFLLAYYWNFGWLILLIFPIPSNIITTFLSIWYVNRKIIKIKVSPWQSFVAPLLSGIVYYIITDLFTVYVGGAVMTFSVIGGAFVILIVAFLILPFFVYMPLYALFGGYDTRSLEDFRKAMELSGPSKWLIKPCYKAVHFVAKSNPFRLHNRFPISLDGVQEEIDSLMKIKQENDANITPI